ncbi:MAG: Methyltransferase [Candidatus Jettenia ecosi]|uniref:Methyltransferase n=1 Tax=Candidatus Jettenia ecosi TaxID=2494326 RepID=A0A533Q8N4_9BACT|nr:MAG: Methyltransferase [Candidatus Jettenia ecosi]
MTKIPDYYQITESPGLRATQEQIARLYQRYRFAKQFCEDKDVLEVACGSGIGLGYLAQVAHKVIGGDIDEKNITQARTYYNAKHKIKNGSKECALEIGVMDAHKLSFIDSSIDTVLLFEAIYYLNDPLKFILEAERVLREKGKLIMCSVNKDWKDFHPSPYTYKYFSVPELYEILKDTFTHIEMYGGFPVNNNGIKNKLISIVKRTAVHFNLIPQSLKTRAYLKRIFMGMLVPLSHEVYEDMALYETPIPTPYDRINKDFKIIYTVANK